MKIKAAIVGLGRISSLLEDDSLREKPCTHTGAVTANEDCILVAGCDTNEERRRLYAEKWSTPNNPVCVYDNASKMIDIHQPQLLVIATHPDSHYEYCRMANEKKKKGIDIRVVICEKPLADNIDSARKIAQMPPGGGIKIITNHERRYSNDYIKAKTILEEESLGKLISVKATLYFGKTRKLIDMFWDDGTHLIDAIMFLTDSILLYKNQWGADINERSGTAWLEGKLFEKTSRPNQRFEDAKTPRTQRENKVIPVIIEVGAERDHLVFEIEFSCEKGRLRIGNGVFEIYESVPSPYAENFRSLKNTGEVFSGPTGYFANMLKDAVACVKDPQREPVSGAIDGLRVIEYLNSVKK